MAAGGYTSGFSVPHPASWRCFSLLLLTLAWLNGRLTQLYSRASPPWSNYVLWSVVGRPNLVPGIAKLSPVPAPSWFMSTLPSKRHHVSTTQEGCRSLRGSSSTSRTAWKLLNTHRGPCEQLCSPARGLTAQLPTPWHEEHAVDSWTAQSTYARDFHSITNASSSLWFS